MSQQDDADRKTSLHWPREAKVYIIGLTPWKPNLKGYQVTLMLQRCGGVATLGYLESAGKTIGYSSRNIRHHVAWAIRPRKGQSPHLKVSY